MCVILLTYKQGYEECIFLIFLNWCRKQVNGPICIIKIVVIRGNVNKIS